jgi:hypothetical protein
MAKHDRLRRRGPRREPLARILVVCEGTRTEPSYFQGMRHLQRSLVELELSPGGTPKTLVERAVEKKKEAVRAAKRSADRNQLYDEIWCVFDIDEHPFVPEAKDQAQANGIPVAVSNPCFELWILLHFQDQRGHMERGQVQSLCRKYLPDYEKKVPCERLAALHADAVRRATDLETWQELRGCKGDNPSTGVHLLAERIRILGRGRE